MPIYEYKCTKCGEGFELRRGMSDSDDEIKCPRCQAEHPERIFSVFASGSIAKGRSSSGNICASPTST